MSNPFDRGLVPLTNPEMPPVHDDFVAWAARQQESVETVLLRCLYTPGGYTMPLTATSGGEKVTAELLAGHRWYERDTRKSLGPEHCPAMIIGKGPSLGDMGPQRYFSGDMAQVMLDAMKAAKLSEKEVRSIYVCGTLATPPLVLGKNLAVWYKVQSILWLQQLLLVRPEIVLLQGAEAVKEVLGKKFTLTNTEGQVTTRKFNLADSPDHEPVWHEIKFVTSVSPAAVLHDRALPGTDTKYKTQNEKRLHRGLVLFRQTWRGEDTQVNALDNAGFTVVSDTAALEEQLKRMRAETVDKIIAWDAEWQGNHPTDSDHYLRCIQFCWNEEHAVVISLTEPGGEPCFMGVDGDGNPSLEAGPRDVARLCNEYMQGMRLAGHYFNADMKALMEFGLDFSEEFDAAPTWEQVETHGGIAIELAAHAFDETQLFSLDDQIAARLDNFPIYSQALEAFKKEAIAAADTELAKRLAEPQEAIRAYKHQLKLYENRTKTQIPMTDALRQKRIFRIQEQLENLRKAEERVPAAVAAIREARQWYADRRAEMNNGYGWMPAEKLYPYAAWDVVAELKLARVYLGMLKSDRFGNDCREAYWNSHRASPAVLEINRNGVYIDRDRLDTMSIRFKNVRDKLEARIRELSRWPDMRLSSRFEFAELLFGDEYNGRFPQYGKHKRLRPIGALTVRAEPLLSTGTYPEIWEQVIERGAQMQVAPSTSKQVLGEMFHEGENLRVRRFDDTEGVWYYTQADYKELISLLRDFRMIDQAIKQVLAPPETDAFNELIYEDDDGNLDFSSGLASCICEDGMVRTTIRQTLETARWASVNPNMQNMSKSREADYKRIIAMVELWATQLLESKPVESYGRWRFDIAGTRPKYMGTSVRSVVSAIGPDHPYSFGEQWYLVESDYTGAELLISAIAAGDVVMIDHCRRNQLPEDHPDFFDIHSNLTVQAFRLPCAPTKAGLSSIGKKHLRTAGKSVIFGVMYGRTAKAIAIALRQEGVHITMEEAQDLITALFKLYPDLKLFLDSCRKRVKVGYLFNMFGRPRRFPFTRDEQKLRAMEREAMNAPIQGSVADAVNRAVRNIQEERYAAAMRFRIVLAIHDAVLLMVPQSELYEVCKPGGILKRAMIDQVPLVPRDLDGKVTMGGEVYHFGTSIDVHTHWGELFPADKLLEIELPPDFVGWSKVQGGWHHSETDTKVLCA